MMKLLGDGDISALLPGTHEQQQATLADVLARYREPSRAYHGVVHVRTVVSQVIALLNDARVGPVANPETVVWAALWHDAVYDARSPTNEADSAVLARRSLASAGVDHPRIDEVERLVMLTAGHLVDEGDIAGAVLVDADLCVLGADPAAYARYVEGVRAEYHFVPDAAWRTGRAAVLRRILDLPRIFTTAPMSSRNAIARDNLGDELDKLTTSVSADQ